jgi:hypothetical protein
MGRLSAPLLVLVLAAAAVGLTSCGSGGSSALLPGATASQINSNLDKVQQLVSEGDCIGAEDAAGSVSAQVEELSGVDKKLKEALSEGAQRLNEVVANCEEVPSEEEELQTLEEAQEAEEAETEKKEKKEKPDKAKPEKEAEKEGEEAGNPSLPPQSNGKGKGLEEGSGPPEEEGDSQSGGVGPGAPAGEE